MRTGLISLIYDRRQAPCAVSAVKPWIDLVWYGSDKVRKMSRTSTHEFFKYHLRAFNSRYSCSYVGTVSLTEPYKISSPSAAGLLKAPTDAALSAAAEHPSQDSPRRQPGDLVQERA
jgi:hypothetical protein